MRKLLASVVVGVAASASVVAVPSTAFAVTAVPPTTQINSTPLNFDRTDGDILAIAKVVGAPDELAFGGNFTTVFTPDAKPHAAQNFAIVQESTGTVLYSGAQLAPTDYVRSITSFGGDTYVGGDFMTFAGSPRKHAAAIDSTFALTAWNPAPGGTVRALAADASAVYMGGDFAAAIATDPGTGATLWSKLANGGSIHAMLETNGFLYIGGLFEVYDTTTQHGAVKVNPSDGSIVSAFKPVLRADSGKGTHGTDDGEDIISMSVGPNTSEIMLGSGGNAPAGDSSNEAILTDANTGARLWKVSLIGDCQALGLVGNTVIAGYHHNTELPPYPHFATQLELSNGNLTTWDPLLTGDQGNADGGNNGVQAMFVDQSTNTIYIAGAFDHYNNVFAHESLIAFTFTPPAGTHKPTAPSNVQATASDASATVTWSAPSDDGGAPITGYTVTGIPGGAAVSTGTSVTVTGLTNNTSYTFKVTATNSVGTSPSSAPSNLVIPTAGGGSGGGGGGGGAPVVTTPVRLAGADRFGTANATAAAEFPNADSAGAVVLARADNYPDALVGTALAAAKNAPLLFVNGSLTPETQATIVHVLPAGGTVYLLGGTAAIPASVEASLTSLGFVPVRYAGADRYATALAVADALGDPHTVFLATGINFPDALSAGPAAARVGGVVLLTNGGTLPASVQQYLTAHVGPVFAVGGPAAAADPSATPLSGADRYATAVAVAQAIFSSPVSVGVASGVAFPDALSGGAYEAHIGGPILLTSPTSLSPPTNAYLTGTTTVSTTNVFGGTSALSAAVEAQVSAALGVIG